MIATLSTPHGKLGTVMKVDFINPNILLSTPHGTLGTITLSAGRFTP